MDTLADKFSIYPNPASDLITINTIENIDKVALYLMAGQLVIHKNITTKHIATKHLKSGLYIL